MICVGLLTMLSQWSTFPLLFHMNICKQRTTNISAKGTAWAH